VGRAARKPGQEQERHHRTLRYGQKEQATIAMMQVAAACTNITG